MFRDAGYVGTTDLTRRRGGSWPRWRRQRPNEGAESGAGLVLRSQAVRSRSQPGPHYLFFGKRPTGATTESSVELARIVRDDDTRNCDDVAEYLEAFVDYQSPS
jgi:hypothetical protein